MGETRRRKYSAITPTHGDFVEMIEAGGGELIPYVVRPGDFSALMTLARQDYEPARGILLAAGSFLDRALKADTDLLCLCCSTAFDAAHPAAVVVLQPEVEAAEKMIVAGLCADCQAPAGINERIAKGLEAAIPEARVVVSYAAGHA